MHFLATPLPGVVVVEPEVFRDGRGLFLETYHAAKYREGGISDTFVQDNQSVSVAGTLRGLHAQRQHPQGKLVRVLDGEIFDVAVDIRVGSATFLCWFGVLLSSDNYRQIYVPPGFAHGFCVVSERAVVAYQCTDFYDPADELRIRWDDPSIGVKWPVHEPLLSPKDAAAASLMDQFAALPVAQAVPTRTYARLEPLAAHVTL